MYNLIHTSADVSSRCESLKGMRERSELILCTVYTYIDKIKFEFHRSIGSPDMICYTKL